MKIEKLHEEAIKSNSNEEDFDAVTSGYILYDDNFEKVANQSAEITKDIAIKFAEFLRTNYQNSALEFDNYWQKVEQGEFYLELGKTYTTEELFNIFIETL